MQTNNIVALCWSFKNDLQEVPYKIDLYYLNTKPKWSCSCPASRMRSKICKHIITLQAMVKNKFEDSHYTITDYGKKIFNIKT